MEIIHVVLLAITKMHNGYCFAGMTCNGKWIRPVLAHQRQWGSLMYENEEKIKIGDIIDVRQLKRLSPKRPEMPHIEDVVVQRMIKVGELAHHELIEFLKDVVEGYAELEDTLARKNRSLCLVEVSSLKKVYVEEEDRKRTRISFKLPNVDFEYINTTQKPGYPCVCLHWRAIQGHGIEIPDKFNSIFLGIGLARGFFSGNRWVDPTPMVISVITDPALPLGIDYDNP